MKQNPSTVSFKSNDVVMPKTIFCPLFLYRNDPRLNHTKQCQLIFLDVSSTGAFPSSHKPGSFEAGPARGNDQAGITMHIQPWNPALVTGTYMFTPGLAKPHVLQSKELPLNTGHAGGLLTQGDESKAPKASNKLSLFGIDCRPRPVQIDSTNTDNHLKQMHPDSSIVKGAINRSR